MGVSDEFIHSASFPACGKISIAETYRPTVVTADRGWDRNTTCRRTIKLTGIMLGVNRAFGGASNKLLLLDFLTVHGVVFEIF